VNSAGHENKTPLKRRTLLGYKLDAIIEELRFIDADVLAIQEIDVHCERSAFEV
jgi:hypothetical protein